MELTPNAALLPPNAAGAPGQSGEADTSAANSDFDSFLRLLTAQLRNQDPLQPIDSTEFVAQLASFSTVEQLIGTNERLDSLLARGSAADTAALAGWIGREVTATDGRFRATGEPRRFTVPAIPEAERLDAVVRRSDGGEVARFAVAVPSGETAVWDGRDAFGATLVDVDLTLEIEGFVGRDVVARRSGGVLREITGILGTEAGPVIELADGGVLRPDQIGRVGAIPVTEDPA